MPIVQIDIVAREGERFAENLARKLADDLAEAKGGCAPGRVWATLNIVPATRYAENGDWGERRVFPVVARVLKSAVPKEGDLAEEAARVATAIAGALNRPLENVHVIYEPAAAGRVAFGGVLFRG